MEVSSNAMEKKIPLIVILGPTSAGKTALSLELAQEYCGEIVSADSRQVYRGMNVGTNKVTGDERQLIAHHLIDVKDPREQMTLAEYKQRADAAIYDIAARGKLPFLVGGSPLYLRAVIDNYEIPQVPANESYRQELELEDLALLLEKLRALDPETFQIIDRKNPRRIVRALEVIHATGKPFSSSQKRGPQHYRTLLLGIDRPRDELYLRVDRCVDRRIQEGMIEEVVGLMKKGIDPKRLIGFGLEYKYITLFLQGSLTKEEAIQQLKFATHDFARRQLTWFRKDTRIHWIGNKQHAESLISKHLSGEME